MPAIGETFEMDMGNGTKETFQLTGKTHDCTCNKDFRWQARSMSTAEDHEFTHPEFEARRVNQVPA